MDTPFKLTDMLPQSDTSTKAKENRRISYYDLVPSADNFYSMQNLEELKNSIELAGHMLRTAYKNEQYHLQDEIRMIPDKITDKERLLAALQQDGRTFAAHHAESVGDTFRAEISGTVYTQKEDAGNALLQRIESETAKIKAGADDALAWEKSLPIGHYCGFELYLTRDPLQNCILWVRGETKRQVETGMTPQGMMQRLGNALSGIEEHIPDCEKRIALLNEQLKTAKAELDKPWPQEDEYQIKVARLDELNFLLSKKDDQPQIGLEQPQPELA